MEKITITKEQAEALEEVMENRTKISLISEKANPFISAGRYMCEKSHIVFNEIDLETLIKALYIGYEVEPEYKVGDWVITEGYSGDYDGKALEITHINEEKYGKFVYFNNPENDRDNFLITRIKRHATEEEIWWAKHGRKPWELKQNDILINNETLEYATVWGIKGQLVITSECNEVSVTTLKENSRVICFAEDRKDVQA